jgi:hypothetical protein
MEHDWHAFDVGRGWEVRRLASGEFEARQAGDSSRIWRLTPVEFDQWRSDGPNPQDLT